MYLEKNLELRSNNMADTTLTPEELKFLEDNNLPIPVPLEEDDTTTSTELNEDELDFLNENNLSVPEPLKIFGGTGEDWQGESAKFENENTKVKAPVIEKDKRDAFTYDNLYGEVTLEDGNKLEEPNLSVFDSIGAMFYDAVNPEDAPKKKSQVARDTYNEEIEKYSTAVKDLYESDAFYTEGVNQIYDRYIPVKDAEGNVTKYNYEKVLIPNPEFDSSGFRRVIDQAGRNIYQELGGLLTEGAIMGNSKFAESRPDMDLSGGEEIASTILSIAAPTLPVTKALKYYGGLVKYAATAGKSGDVGTKGTALAVALGGAVSETVMSGQGDEGLFVKPSAVNDLLPNISDQNAKNLAMFIDGLALNGVMDGALSLLGRGLGFAYGKVSAGKQALNKNALKKAVQDGTLLEVFKYLDPDIVNLKPAQLKLRISSLADKLNDNRIIKVALGDVTGEITADTTNAVMMSSEAYIRETRAGLKNTMSAEAFEELVNTEAARMSSSMIGLFRSQLSDSRVAATVDSVPNQIGEFITEAAEIGGDVDVAAQSVASQVVKGADDEVAALNLQKNELNSQTDEILNAQSDVIIDNPVLQDIVGDLTGIDNLFTNTNNEMRQKLTELVSTDVYDEFVAVMDEVDLAYKNLPEAPIDVDLFNSKLAEVTESINLIDNTGARTKAALNELFDSPVDDVMENIGEGLNFKDLYTLKARLARVIDAYSDQPSVMQKLQEFRKHITDEKTGQMEYVIRTQDDPAIAAAYKAADDKYKLAKAQFARSEPMSRLTDTFQEMRKFDYEDANYPGPGQRNQDDVVLAGSQFVNEVIADETGTLMDGLIFAAKDIVNPEELKGSFRDMFVAKAANSLRDVLASGSGGGDPEKVLFNAFAPVREQLQRLGDQDLLDRVQKAFDQVSAAHSGLGDVKAANDLLVKELDASIKQAHEGVVKQLIDTTATGTGASTVTSSAKDVIQSIMTSKNSANRMQELVNKIDLLPDDAQKKLAREALQAVALNTVGEKIFGATGTALKTGTKARKNINIGAVSKLSADDTSNLFKSINVVYGNDSAMAEAVTDVVNMMYQTSLPSRLKVSQAGSDTIVNAARSEDIRDAVSTAILLTAGYMNPTAAMLRRITSVPIAEAERLQKEVAANVLAVIVSQPAKFEELLRELAKGQGTTVRKVANKLALEAVSATAAGSRYEIRVIEEDAFGKEENSTMDRDMLELFSMQ
tara:strand:+ start:1537 stop:5178 length:3642 start_codon:yes stop_codon:yes gene_type:complete